MLPLLNAGNRTGVGHRVTEEGSLWLKTAKVGCPSTTAFGLLFPPKKVKECRPNKAGYGSSHLLCRFHQQASAHIQYFAFLCPIWLLPLCIHLVAQAAALAYNSNQVEQTKQSTFHAILWNVHFSTTCPARLKKHFGYLGYR